MRRSTIVATVAVLWAAFVVIRAGASGFSFESGSYGNGQKFAVVLAIVVLIVGVRELLNARRRSAS
jgi:hypothetical protein